MSGLPWIWRGTAAAVCCLLVACSSVRPWQNPVAKEAPSPGPAPAAGPVRDIRDRPIVAVVALSGGGARAAAFGLGVLRELKATTFTWAGRTSSLMDQVGLISGVSGGSILAAYYAAFGDETFTRFEPDFLLDDFESGLVTASLAPSKLVDLTSPWYGRSNVLAERLDALYRGRTYGDLQNRREGPELLVTATDLTTGAPFEFDAAQFGLICSDLRAVPLSFAVASSSAVPILLTPTTLSNHAGECAPGAAAAQALPGTVRDYRGRLLQASAAGYRDASNRPFIHLVDGGLVDNLGVRGLLDRVAIEGSIVRSFDGVAPGTVHRLVMIVVNAERDPTERIDRSERVPDTSQVVNALLFGAGSRGTQATLALLDDDAERWRRELAGQRGQPASPFAADAQIHVVTVSLRDVEDAARAGALLHIPTALTIASTDVQRLQAAGREALRRSPAFQQLVRSLDSGPHR